MVAVGAWWAAVGLENCQGLVLAHTQHTDTQ